MAVGQRAGDGESLGERGAEVRLAFQDAAQGVNFFRGPAGEVSEGAVFDLAVDAEGFAEEDGGGRVDSSNYIAPPSWGAFIFLPPTPWDFILARLEEEANKGLGSGISLRS